MDYDLACIKCFIHLLSSALSHWYPYFNSS